MTTVMSSTHVDRSWLMISLCLSLIGVRCKASLVTYDNLPFPQEASIRKKKWKAENQQT